MDNLNQGTPKTLDDAIRMARYIGPMKNLEERTYWAVRDFLAQRFGTAVLEHKGSENVLMELFGRIVKRQE